MDGSITVTKSALVKLVDGMLYPTQMIPVARAICGGPYGSIGPIIRGTLHDFSWLMLNPQPLPPKITGLMPEPWRSAVVARSIIDQVVAQYRLAEVMCDGEQAERATEALRSQIGEFVDEYCGTGRPRRGPLPSPFPLRVDPAEFHPTAALVAGAHFQKAAGSMGDGPLEGAFSAAADRLLKTGMG